MARPQPQVMVEVGAVLVNRVIWPRDGTVGRIAKGGFEGVYPLLTPEVDA